MAVTPQGDSPDPGDSPDLCAAQTGRNRSWVEGTAEGARRGGARTSRIRREPGRGDRGGRRPARRAVQGGRGCAERFGGHVVRGRPLPSPTRPSRLCCSSRSSAAATRPMTCKALLAIEGPRSRLPAHRAPRPTPRRDRCPWRRPGRVAGSGVAARRRRAGGELSPARRSQRGRPERLRPSLASPVRPDGSGRRRSVNRSRAWIRRGPNRSAACLRAWCRFRRSSRDWSGR
jgi:hypothetical protein